MPTYVALLRGINLGSRNRLAMADLRDLLVGLGYDEVRTHLQSGNAVLRTGTRSAATVGKAIEKALDRDAGLPVRVLMRSASQIAKVAAADPFEGRATDPSRCMVVFLEKPLTAKAVSHVDRDAYLPEEFAVDGKQLYLWLPVGTQGSKLTAAMSEQRLGVVGTMRNWRTVTRLAELASG